MVTTITTPELEKYSSLFAENKEQLLAEYFQFLRFKSISADPAYTSEMQKCFLWLQNLLRSMEFDVEQWDTCGHPTLFASRMSDSNKPTILFYQHYDVQPVDPIEQWHDDPFEPVLKHGQIYARGAQDNKGQCFYTLMAIKHFVQQYADLPFNIKICIEGEEEIGSGGLAAILQEKQSALQADYLMVIDVGLPSIDQPSVTLGLRGMVTMEIVVTGSNIDLHSGSHGGIVYNPIHALVEMLAKLRDATGTITVPGFYDGIIELSPQQQKNLSFNFDAHAYEQMFGAIPCGGEKAFSSLQSNWLRPTLEINGICGGYTGKGPKSVIPAKASAKISCRLVPGQDPNDIAQKVMMYLQEIAPTGIKIEGQIHAGGGIAVRSGPESEIVQIVAQAFSDVCQKPCNFILEGASIPIVARLSDISRSEVVLFGYGLADDQIHAPNEHFGWDRFEKGFLTVVRVLQILSEKIGQKQT